jgi:hypothetical protein
LASHFVEIWSDLVLIIEILVSILLLSHIFDKSVVMIYDLMIRNMESGGLLLLVNEVFFATKVHTSIDIYTLFHLL